MSPEVDEQVDYFEHPLQTTCDWGLRLERDNQMGCGIFCMSGRFGDLIGGLEFCWRSNPLSCQGSIALLYLSVN